METKKKAWGFMGPFSVACVWFGTHVGPGFAGGAQLVSYFTKWGWIGVFLGPLVVALLSTYLIYYTMEFCRLYKTDNYHEFYKKVYGKYTIFFGTVKSILLVLGCFVVAAMIYATGGALLQSLLGFPAYVGGLLTMAVIVLLTIFGEALVRKSSTVLTVVMIAMILYIAIRAIGPSWGGMREYVGSRTMNASYPTAWWNMILYLPVFCSFMDAGIATSQSTVKSSRDSILIAIMGSILIGGSIMLLNIMFSARMPEIQSEALPTLFALQHVMGNNIGITILYTVLAFLALISTGVGFLYGAVARYEIVLGKVWKQSSATLRRAVILIAIMIGSVVFGQFGVLTIIQYGYVYMGNINLPVLMLPLMILLPILVGRAKKKQTPAVVETDK
ncbi:MAG: hypothetical protein GX567_19365 [Clostridia bacterium]|nr:hypothetical protein [Clostridia bacterium]